MKVFEDLGLEDFQAWSGAVSTKKVILENNLEAEFENFIEECYPEGINATLLNDILWFESDWVYENIGIQVEE